MIDLHLHTIYSDGRSTLKELLEEAQNANLEIISITDHDTLEAYNELKNFDYKEIYKGRIIPGIEFTVVFNGIKFHMLAYDFDIEKLKPWVDETYKEMMDLNIEFELMHNNLKKHNIIMGEINYKKEDGWPVDILYEEIKKYEENKKYFTEDEWKDPYNFYYSSLNNKDFPGYADFSKYYPNAKDVTKKVREAGGKTFLAHVFRDNPPKLIEFLENLRINNIIDGVEVWHLDHTEEESKILEEYCIEKKLLMSGGSDYHGINKKTGVGYKNLHIKKDILNNWNIKREI